MKFKLLKDVLDWPRGYILKVDEQGNGLLNATYTTYESWKIPMFIMTGNPDYFEKVEDIVQERLI